MCVIYDSFIVIFIHVVSLPTTVLQSWSVYLFHCDLVLKNENLYYWYLRSLGINFCNHSWWNKVNSSWWNVGFWGNKITKRFKRISKCFCRNSTWKCGSIFLGYWKLFWSLLSWNVCPKKTLFTMNAGQMDCAPKSFLLS